MVATIDRNSTYSDIMASVKEVCSTAVSQTLTSQFGITGQYLMYVMNGTMSIEEAIKAGASQAVSQLGAKALNSIFTKVGSAITGALSKSAQATAEVGKQATELKSAEQRAVEIAKISDENLKAAVSEIDKATEQIKEALETAQASINESIEKEKEDIEELQEQIAEQVALLNSDETKPEDKPGIIDKIISLGGIIESTASAANAKVTAILAETNTNVLTAEMLITGKMNEAIKIISTNLENIKGVEVQTAAHGAKVITLDNTKGGTEAAEAAAATAAASAETAGAAFTLGTTGALAAKNAAKAADLGAASATHFGGAAAEITNLANALGSISGINAEVVYNIQMVGQYGTNAANLLGQYMVEIPKMITSVGSITEGVKNTNASLNSKAEEYRRSLTQTQAPTDKTDKKKFEFDANEFSNFNVEINFGLSS